MLDAPTKKNASISGAEASTTPNTCIYPFRGGSFLRLPEAYFRFKGLISHLPEVYLRFEGLLIHVIGSINGYTSTSFRRFRAVSTWASAPRSGSRLPDKAKSAPRSRESTFLRCQKPTERKRVVCTQTTHMINSPIDAANAPSAAFCAATSASAAAVLIGQEAGEAGADHAADHDGADDQTLQGRAQRVLVLQEVDGSRNGHGVITVEQTG